MLVLSSLFFWHQYEVKTAVVKATNAIELQHAKEKFKLIDKAQAETFALQDQVDAITKDKNVKVQALNARVATLTRSLQERPIRPESSGVSVNPGVEETSQGATGVQLYREDGLVLIREAARAELIKEELLGCYKSYDAAKEALDRYKKENTPRSD